MRYIIVSDCRSLHSSYLSSCLIHFLTTNLVKTWDFSFLRISEINHFFSTRVLKKNDSFQLILENFLKEIKTYQIYQ